jgi:hypothetical protein
MKLATSLIFLFTLVACGLASEPCVDPHGPLYWPTAISDVIIFLAYFAIPIELVYYSYSIGSTLTKELWVVVIFFVLFIIFCGLTHFLFFVQLLSFQNGVVLTIIKVATAIVSVATAALCVHVFPQAIRAKKDFEESNRRMMVLHRAGSVIRAEYKEKKVARGLCRELRELFEVPLVGVVLKKTVPSSQEDPSTRAYFFTVNREIPERSVKSLLKTVDWEDVHPQLVGVAAVRDLALDSDTEYHDELEDDDDDSFPLPSSGETHIPLPQSPSHSDWYLKVLSFPLTSPKHNDLTTVRLCFLTCDYRKANDISPRSLLFREIYGQAELALQRSFNIKAIEQQHAELEGILASCIHAVFLVDTAYGRIVKANQACHTVFRAPRDSFTFTNQDARRFIPRLFDYLSEIGDPGLSGFQRQLMGYRYDNSTFPMNLGLGRVRTFLLERVFPPLIFFSPTFRFAAIKSSF